MKGSTLILMLLTFAVGGCRTKTETTPASPEVDIAESMSSAMSADRVTDLARSAAKANGYELDSFAAPRITFNSESEQWSLFFEGTVVPSPGNHFLVIVDDKTGNTSVRHGE